MFARAFIKAKVKGQYLYIKGKQFVSENVPEYLMLNHVFTGHLLLKNTDTKFIHSFDICNHSIFNNLPYKF